MRRFFIAGEDKVLVDADYSQIELRVLAHISGDENMKKAFLSGEDIHSQTASGVFGVPAEEVTSDMRRRAKTVNFGILYGMGAYSLSQDLGISVFEATGYINSYFATYPGVSRYMDETIALAHEKGYVKTMFGRIRDIEGINVKNKTVQAAAERIAMNTPIQGSAADIIKIAMIAVHHRLKKELPKAKLVLQVHDELICQCDKEDKEQVVKILVEEMANAAQLEVALKADFGYGENWLVAKG